MIRACLAACLGIWLMSCATVPNELVAGERPNILIVGQDNEYLSASCASPLFQAVADTLNDQLSLGNFKTHDAMSVSLDRMRYDICNRSDRDLLKLARSLRSPPIDILIIFRVFAHPQQTEFAAKYNISLTGRMIDMRTKRTIRSFSVKSPPDEQVSHDCHAECLIQHAVAESRILAQDLGHTLTQMLKHWQSDRIAEVKDASLPALCSGDAAYRLVFNDFHREEIRVIEEYLAAFRCFQHYRPTRVSGARSEYWYETSADSARLNRNLGKMLDHISVQGRIAYAGNTFTIHKLHGGKRR